MSKRSAGFSKDASIYYSSSMPPQSEEAFKKSVPYDSGFLKMADSVKSTVMKDKPDWRKANYIIPTTSEVYSEGTLQIQQKLIGYGLLDAGDDDGLWGPEEDGAIRRIKHNYHSEVVFDQLKGIGNKLAPYLEAVGRIGTGMPWGPSPDIRNVKPKPMGNKINEANKKISDAGGSGIGKPYLK